LSQGVTPEAFAFDLREQLLLQRLREREVDARIKITEAEIDDYIKEQQRLSPLSNLSLNLANILLEVPSGADASLVAKIETHARTVAAKARAGQDFTQLVQLHSTASDAAQGGSLGMRPVERLPELFTAFTQMDAGYSRSREGSGLGLALAARLAAIMGGKIWVESEPGRGSRFHVLVKYEVVDTE
jgi:peptidyl-prolyl cis-trans isomerase SurA